MKINELAPQPEVELTEQELENIVAGSEFCFPNRTCDDDQDQDQDQDKRW